MFREPDDIKKCMHLVELLPHPAIPTVEAGDDCVILWGYEECLYLEFELSGCYTLRSERQIIFGCEDVNLSTAICAAIDYLSAPMHCYAVPVDQALERVQRGGLPVRKEGTRSLIVTRPVENGVWSATRNRRHPWVWRVIGPLKSEELLPKLMPWELFEEVLGISGPPIHYARID